MHANEENDTIGNIIVFEDSIVSMKIIIECKAWPGDGDVFSVDIVEFADFVSLVRDSIKDKR